MSAMMTLIKKVGMTHWVNPVSRSVRQEPRPLAQTASRRPKYVTPRRMAVSPRCAYPSGIGIWITMVRMQMRAVSNAPQQRENVLKYISFVSPQL